LMGVLSACSKTTGSYTYNVAMGASPLNWNPHTWETNADNAMASYGTEMGLVDIVFVSEGVYGWAFEMADSVTDITATFADKAKWGIPADHTGRVWEIKLNKDAVWEDGTPINADTYIYSMQQLLDPKMQNYRANNYYSGDAAILNGSKYFYSSSPVYAPVVPAYGNDDTPDYSFDIENNQVFLGFGKPTTFTSNYTIDWLVSNGYIKGEAAEFYSELKKNANPFGYTPVTAENKEKAIAICTAAMAAFGVDYSEEYFKEWLFYNTGEFTEAFDFNKVGIVKVDDYTFLYITENPITQFYFYIAMASNWIVYKDLYEANKQESDGLISTKYGTSIDTYMSYGPYKLVSFEKDKQWVLEKNDAWYGYHDEEYKGQFQTTKIVVNIIPDHQTQLNMFLAGQLDDVELEANDLKRFGYSDYLQKTDTTYTFRYIFNSDLTALKKLEELAGDGANKRVLYYDNFRKAMSLSINRSTYTAEGTAGHKPAYYLINYLYYYDVENNPSSVYRNSEQAMAAICDLYGIEYGEGKEFKTVKEAYDAITGYDVEEARRLFQEVYEEAIEDGNYTAGQQVKINVMVSAASSLTETDTAQERILNEAIAAATKGTGFEGKITLVFLSGAAKRYDDVAAGNIEAIRGAWGGAAYYPHNLIRCYVDPDYQGGLAKIHESGGWNPTAEVLTLTINGQEMTKTLQGWAKTIIPSGEYAEDIELRVTILAALENAVLESYQCIPVSTETVVSMYSQKVKFATLNYNIMYGYGGIRFMTYNYNDAEWAKYVAANNGQLDYE
jgi:oligopeptide transport system substrate-binding protein